MAVFTPWAALPAAQQAEQAARMAAWLDGFRVRPLNPRRPRDTYNRAGYLRRKLRAKGFPATVPHPQAQWFGLTTSGAPCWHPDLASKRDEVVTHAYLRLMEVLTR